MHVRLMRVSCKNIFGTDQQLFEMVGIINAKKYLSEYFALRYHLLLSQHGDMAATSVDAVTPPSQSLLQRTLARKIQNPES